MMNHKRIILILFLLFSSELMYSQILNGLLISFTNNIDSTSYTTIVEIDSMVVISSSFFDSDDYKVKIKLSPELSTQLTQLLLQSKELFMSKKQKMYYASHSKLIGCKIPYFEYNYLGLANEIDCDLYFILKTFFMSLHNENEALKIIWDDFFSTMNK